jgi:hypothetical protein
MKNNAIRHFKTASGESVWSLESNRTAYVFGLNQQGRLQHMYWGPRLVLESDYGAPAMTGTWPFERPSGISL